MSGILHKHKLNNGISFKLSAPNTKWYVPIFFSIVFNKSESFFHYLELDTGELILMRINCLVLPTASLCIIVEKHYQAIANTITDL